MRFKIIIRFIISSILSIVILSFIVLVVNFSGTHIKNNENYTDYKWESNQFKSTIFEGFSWMNMDENGFNNMSSEVNDIDVLLMGSSHVEAVNVNKKENFGYLMSINSDLDMKVYNIGISGHTIYRCFDNLENALKKFNPTKYVVIETSTINLNPEIMSSILNGDSEKLKSYDSGLFYFIQKNIYAVKPIFKQLTEMIKTDKNVFANAAKCEEIENPTPSNNFDLIHYFLSKASETAENHGVKLILLYHPETTIDKDGSLVMEDGIDESVFSEICKNSGIVYVSMKNDFSRLYQDEHKLPHGFNNSAVGVGHLNKFGHKAIANRLIMTIKELEDTKNANY